MGYPVRDLPGPSTPPGSGGLNNPVPEMLALAREQGALPDEFEVGQTFERVPHLNRDGTRIALGGADHTFVRIVGVPGGRRRMLSFVKLDPRSGGNGGKDRQVKRMEPKHFARHYAIVGSVLYKYTSVGVGPNPRLRVLLLTGEEPRP